MRDQDQRCKALTTQVVPLFYLTVIRGKMVPVAYKPEPSSYGGNADYNLRLSHD